MSRFICPEEEYRVWIDGIYNGVILGEELLDWRNRLVNITGYQIVE